MVVSPLPILLCLPLVVISALIGMPMVKKLVQIREARHELKRNSTSVCIYTWLYKYDLHSIVTEESFIPCGEASGVAL